MLNEKPLHASLKAWYAKPGDRFEVKVDGFVIDLVQDDLLIEIQTSSFASIKSKLTKLARAHQIRLIYPIAQEKWIVKLPKDSGHGVTRRKSPKKGRVEDLFGEMVSFPGLLKNPNFTLEVLMTREEELRRYDERRNWRRRGWGIEERRLLEVVDRKLFAKPADWRRLLPETLAQPFSVKDLAAVNNLGNPLAQKMAYCLRKAKVINLAGKQGNANLYEIADA